MVIVVTLVNRGESSVPYVISSCGEPQDVYEMYQLPMQRGVSTLRTPGRPTETCVDSVGDDYDAKPRLHPQTA